MNLERYEGALLGLALGDALGAPYEGGVLERALWRLLGRTRSGKRRWTDDTQMSLDLAESLIERGEVDPDDLATRFAASYRWSRGYGPGAAKLLLRLRRGEDWERANRAVFADGSFGNGGAMRAPVIGLFFAGRLKVLPRAARNSARVTHAHPLGLEGAVLIAAATAMAMRGAGSARTWDFVSECSELPEFEKRIAVARRWLEAGKAVAPVEVRSELGNGMAAAESVVTAIYLALRFAARPFLQLIEFVRKLGGDVDTIGAMAGAIYGATHGVEALPREAIQELERAEDLSRLARVLHAHSASAGSSSSS